MVLLKDKNDKTALDYAKEAIATLSYGTYGRQRARNSRIVDVIQRAMLKQDQK